MADFKPFANQTDNFRYPSSTENQQGFPCGPADQALFNGLFKRIEAELGHVIEYAGIVGNDADLTQLRQAIVQIALSALSSIEDTAGDFDTSGFLLLSQARARLPIFPEILTSNFKMGTTTTGAGNVRIPAGVLFLHRGIAPITTELTDFVTTANKVYHLRWNPTDGFVLRDLANGTYNPGSLPETHVNFDSAYDDMLVARAVTNGSNLVTITDLINRNRHMANVVEFVGKSGNPNASFPNNKRPSQIPSQNLSYSVINFSRRPHASLMGMADVRSTEGDAFPPYGIGGEFSVGVRTLDRYQVVVYNLGDVDIGMEFQAVMF